MRECPACSATIDESATACVHCGREVVAEPLAVPPHVSDAPPAASAGPSVPPRRVSSRELLAGVGAAAVVALVTIGLLMTRSAPSREVEAADRGDEAARTTAVAAPASASGDIVKWSTANTVHWTGTKRNSAAFELDADNMVGIWMRQVRPMLVVRCLANSTEAFVITDSPLKIEPQTDDHTVSFSFDGEAEVRERWQDAADHNALFAPDAVAFTQRMMRARILRFGYTPHNVAPVVAEFNVNGLAPLIQPAAKHCGWTK